MHRALILIGMWGGYAGCRPAPADSAAVAREGVVRPGIDVLLTDSMHLLRGRGVGLVTNNAGVDARGVSNVRRLRDAGVRLVALFSPEHGFRGLADPGAAVASTVDSATGLPIYSLYGRTSAPTPAMLRGIDVILIDLQDAGARYYTYIATAIDIMRAAAHEDSIQVFMLDRPNPIGGAVQGRVLDPAFASMVGRLEVPIRHGMTIGELALLARTELEITVPLTVIPVAGWRRTMALDDTGLPFIPTSPNLRTVESLFHYPGTCLFEGTNLSVGRGSDAPFEQIGAPWLDTAAVLTRLRVAALPGVAFRGVTFTPSRPGDGKYADTALLGIRLTVTNRATYDAPAVAVHMLSAIRAVHAGRFAWIPRHFDRLAGTDDLRNALNAGTDPATIVSRWQPAIARFREQRSRYLLYHPK